MLYHDHAQSLYVEHNAQAAQVLWRAVQKHRNKYICLRREKG